MSNLAKDLKEYFNKTSRQQVLEDWAATKIFDNDIEPQCTAGRDYSKCHIHADNVFGCSGCGNFKTEE